MVFQWVQDWRCQDFGTILKIDLKKITTQQISFDAQKCSV